MQTTPAPALSTSQQGPAVHRRQQQRTPDLTSQQLNLAKGDCCHCQLLLLLLLVLLTGYLKHCQSHTQPISSSEQ